MGNKLVKLLAQFYALDHRGKFQFCKESEEACNWVNASSTREIDCRIWIQEALDKRDDLDKEQKSQILKHSEKDMFWEPDWMHRKHLFIVDIIDRRIESRCI